MLVDGFGTPDLSLEFVRSLTEAGARLRVFEPGRRLFGYRLNVFRRMHRKLLCVDQRVAFVAGMNFGADHLRSFGAAAKQDYAVEVEGEVVQDIHGFMTSEIAPRRGSWVRELPVEGYPVRQAAAGGDDACEPALRPDADTPVLVCASSARVALVVRDNRRHRTDIEKQYRHAMRGARERLTIANAYFFPGYRFLRHVRNAARRGVDVHLLLQGRSDEPIAMHAARLLYTYLGVAGVHIHEYRRSPLHGKVAVIDDDLATVGSSNLDPISLSLNLEANVFIRDRAFACALHEHLDGLMREHSVEVDTRAQRRPTMWRALRSAILFHVLRRFPGWAGLLPAHTPLVTEMRAEADAGARDRAGGEDGGAPR